MFDTLHFKEVRKGHFQARHRFGDYELSVILESNKTKYEAAVFQDGKFIQLPGIHPDYYEDFCDDVIPGLSPVEVDSIMKKLNFLGFISNKKENENVL